jgi:hypothetical protein
VEPPEVELPVELLPEPLALPLLDPPVLVPPASPPLELPAVRRHWPLEQVPPSEQLPVWQGLSSQPSLPPQTVQMGVQAQLPSRHVSLEAQLTQVAPSTPQLAALGDPSQVFPLQQPAEQVEAVQLHRQVPPQPSETLGPQLPGHQGWQQARSKQVKPEPQSVHWPPAPPQAVSEPPG